MKKILFKIIVTFLIMALIVSSAAFTLEQIKGVESIYIESAPRQISESDLMKIFNIQYNPDVKYCGYLFRLIEHADVEFSAEKHYGIREIVSNAGIFRADTLSDIVDFVDIESVWLISPNYVMYNIEPVFEPINDYFGFAPFAFAPVNDPIFPLQWGLDFIRAAASWSMIDAPSPRGVVVAVIDTGIDVNHPDINADNILPGASFINGIAAHYYGPFGNRIPPFDTWGVRGHGTAVTGVIAATRNNGEGLASMGYGVTILPLRIEL